MIKVLFLCTGNSCRSQMAEGFLKQYEGFEVYSAGTNPAVTVDPLAVQVMQELGIDISDQKTESVEKYLGREFDFVITVCDGARENCPVFLGKVRNRLHIGFRDPAGREIGFFRIVRDEIKTAIAEFVKQISS
jgi:arsenate reductase